MPSSCGEASVGAEEGKCRNNSGSVGRGEDFVGVDEFHAHHVQFEEELTADGAPVGSGQERLHLRVFLGLEWMMQM